TGGTSGARESYEKLAAAGVGTIVGMHMSEDHRKEAEKHHINVVIAGHMASDSLGLNLFLDELEQRGVEIVPCSGLLRISRVQRW
ncbi:MAG TPA: NGG1p interacting factor NIF3, partial [Syntrophaceticus sp.]|nr:NGG1p interacting factor NIF3 [Syntrophaceticus sp.]